MCSHILVGCTVTQLQQDVRLEPQHNLPDTAATGDGGSGDHSRLLCGGRALGACAARLHPQGLPHVRLQNRIAHQQCRDEKDNELGDATAPAEHRRRFVVRWRRGERRPFSLHRLYTGVGPPAAAPVGSSTTAAGTSSGTAAGRGGGGLSGSAGRARRPRSHPAQLCSAGGPICG